jgi:hypothetical protein
MEHKNNNSHKAVFGICNSRTDVDEAVASLNRCGFSNSDISVLLPSKEETQNFAHEKATKAPEGAATGVASGAVVGGTLGWLAGIGLLAIPGVGPFVAAGPIVAAISGVGIGGAIGGLTGALIGMGVPEYEAKRYEDFIKDGGILLSVHTDTSEEIDKAKETLEACGIRDISVAGEKQGISEDKNKTSAMPTPRSSDSRRL